MRPKAIKCVCGRGLGSFIKSKGHKKGEYMENLKDLRNMLLTVIKKSIDYDFGYYDFFDQVRWTIMGAIEEGYIFWDYLNYRDEIEDPYEINCGLDEWENIVERAFRKQGYDYEELQKEQIKIDTAIAEKMQEAIDDKDIVVNVKMDEIIKRALNSLNSEKGSTDTDYKEYD